METNVTQLLLAFGFFWIIVGSLIGLSQGLKHSQHLVKLEELATAGDLLGYHHVLSGFKQRTTAHTHSMLFPLVAIVIALSMPQTTYHDTSLALLAAVLAGAAVIWTLGGLLQVKALKGLGDMLLLVSIVMTLAGLV